MNNNSHVCIGIPPIGKDKLGFGQILPQTLAGLGFSPTLVDDSNPAVLKSDALLLIGAGRCFDGFAKLLGNCDRTRPLTILWLIDPLPPPQLSERGLQIGLKLAKCNWQILPQPWVKLIRAVLPFRNDIQKAARWMLTRKIRKDAVANNLPAYTEVSSHEFYNLMESFEWVKRNFELGWIDSVFTTTIQRKQILETIGIDAKIVPIGYHLSWGRKLSLQRDIDVLFIGALRSQRRCSILNDVEKKLSIRGINVVKINDGCYGEQRTALLNRAKIVLDILRIPWETGGVRFLMSISCGALVISEYVENTAPYKPGIHFVQAKSPQLPDAICYYLEHEDERQTIVDSAYKFVTQELTLENSLLQILESCCANSAIQTRSL